MKKALVTGASSGIGRCIVRELSKLGYETILVSRNEEELEKLKETLPSPAEVESVDVGNIESMRELVKKYPHVDVLVNCAGMGVFGEFDKTDFDSESDMIDVNIRALHFLMKAYIPHMKKSGGKILNVSSSAAFFPGPLFSSYYATKAYVYRLSLAVREEMRRENAPVSITVFCPGPVKTPFNGKIGVKEGPGAISPEYAAKYAVKAMLKGKAVAVPGVANKISRLFSGLLPDILYAKIVSNEEKAVY